MAPPTKRNNILIVDDEPEIREIVGMMLSEHGYRIRTAADGVEALELIKEKAPDLILLDMNMPRMGGVVFYHNIASTYDGSPRYPVLVITGRTALEQLFKDFKVDGFISKPFNFEDLLAEVEKTLDKHYGSGGTAAKSADVPASDNSRPKKKNCRVLAIDDNADRFHAIVISFMNAGYEVLGAKNDRLALHSASLDEPDAILLKIKVPIPESPEWALAAAIRQIRKADNIPILFYPDGQAAFFPSAAEKLTQSISQSRILPAGDPDLLLREFERILRGRTNPPQA